MIIRPYVFVRVHCLKLMTAWRGQQRKRPDMLVRNTRNTEADLCPK